MPLGKVSVNGAVSVATVASVFDRVIVSVVDPPGKISAG
jgi:hypothetical protein